MDDTFKTKKATSGTIVVEATDEDHPLQVAYLNKKLLQKMGVDPSAVKGAKITLEVTT